MVIKFKNQAFDFLITMVIKFKNWAFDFFDDHGYK